jgi:hypothetical protein
MRALLSSRNSCALTRGKASHRDRRRYCSPSRQRRRRFGRGEAVALDTRVCVCVCVCLCVCVCVLTFKGSECGGDRDQAYLSHIYAFFVLGVPVAYFAGARVRGCACGAHSAPARWQLLAGLPKGSPRRFDIRASVSKAAVKRTCISVKRDPLFLSKETYSLASFVQLLKDSPRCLDICDGNPLIGGREADRQRLAGGRLGALSIYYLCRVPKAYSFQSLEHVSRISYTVTHS